MDTGFMIKLGVTLAFVLFFVVYKAVYDYHIEHGTGREFERRVFNTIILVMCIMLLISAFYDFWSLPI